MAGTNVWVKSGKTIELLSDATTGVTGPARYKDSPYSSFQATITGTGAVTATIDIEVSNDGTYWCDTVMGTITLAGTNEHTDGFTSVAPWKYVRAILVTITGTDASVTVSMGT